MNIIKLTKEILLENIEELIEIDSVIKINERWRHENFLVELNGKWDNSYVALREDTVAGFIICSIKNERTLHIHRFAVRKEFQNMGVGTQLITKVINSTNHKLNSITLKVKTDNATAHNFYEKSGFKRAYSENENYIYQRLLQ
ncbi:GNAT family N-acetyltransferase [Methanosarcina sp. KYL-1]|uniref:GNAT family N-acetyltransferase n=1 Tax=Methanosarcina sp. KYL-1 TaxID=2602068 RepID=UPI00210173BD|nr:GNAT family N-acetyltransferase [Methanosarcina sp. KYL-1]MCQ1535493.1 GNAT family N-acetyltransferase [Methanosarcina sp. KYL-1]